MRRAALLGLAALVVGCGAPPPEALPVIAPEQFALVACGPSLPDHPCALAVVGGKRLLFGAPAGVAGTLSEAELKRLDGVFLFSLRASDIEGLDEVRNASWNAGRAKPLRVYGPEGTPALVNAVNLAFETADALRIVDEGVPPGGFDAAVLEAVDIAWQSDAALFDTGDVQVYAQVRRDQALRYSIVYRGAAPVVLESCGVAACTGAATGAAGADWPLQGVVFIPPRGEGDKAE